MDNINQRAVRQIVLSENRGVDISVLAGLTNLCWIGLKDIQASDISVLSGLSNLSWLTLSGNQISDISPLVANAGLGTDAIVTIAGNHLDLTPGSQNMLDMETLQDRGVQISQLL